MDAKTLALITLACWCIAPLFDKMSMQRGTPAGVLTIRFLFLAGAYLAWIALRGEWSSLRLDGMTLLWTLGSAVFGAILGLTSYMMALRTGHTAIVIPIANAFPPIVALLAAWLFHEPLDIQRLVSVGLIGAGLLLLR